MKRAIILDFMGVIADINYKKLVLSLPLKEKFSALRVYANIKKHQSLSKEFDNYQKGLSSIEELKTELNKHCKNSTYVIDKVLNALHKFININHKVLHYIFKLKLLGVKIIVISNSIPATEQVIEQINVPELFDEIILSHKIGLKKPEPEIYEYTIKTFNLNPKNTLMLDDTTANLKTAQQLGIHAIKCRNSTDAFYTLENYYKHLLDLKSL